METLAGRVGLRVAPLLSLVGFSVLQRSWQEQEEGTTHLFIKGAGKYDRTETFFDVTSADKWLEKREKF